MLCTYKYHETGYFAELLPAHGIDLLFISDILYDIFKLSSLVQCHYGVIVCNNKCSSTCNGSSNELIHC